MRSQNQRLSQAPQGSAKLPLTPCGDSYWRRALVGQGFSGCGVSSCSSCRDAPRAEESRKCRGDQQP